MNNNKKKILLVTSAFYPELSPRSFRSTELAKEFYSKGFDVTVISKFRDYNYTAFLSRYPVNLKMWKKSSFPMVPEFGKKPFSVLSRVLTRFLMLFFEYPGIEEMILVKKMLKNESNFDLMISFAVPFPIHWGVASAISNRKSLARIWVADCGDPYMFARLDRFRKPFYFKYFESDFCRKCDYISVPFAEMKNQFYPEFRSKIKVIPQGFNLNEIKLCEEKQYNKYPTFIFAGSIIPGKRDLKLFCEFLCSIQIDYLFIVYTNQKEWFERYKIVLKEKLVVNEYIDRMSLIYEMSKVDFLVNVDTNLDNMSNVEAVPSKLIDYAISKRPILNLNSIHLDKELVISFLKGDYSGQRIIELSKYDIVNVSAKFLELCDLN